MAGIAYFIFSYKEKQQGPEGSRTLVTNVGCVEKLFSVHGPQFLYTALLGMSVSLNPLKFKLKGLRRKIKWILDHNNILENEVADYVANRRELKTHNR